MRLDTNYYHYPGTWIGAKPGFMTGSGLIMRFADLDGTIDRRLPGAHVHDRRVGPDVPVHGRTRCSTRRSAREGYYGVFTANMHTDLVDSPGSEAIITSALARSVPVDHREAGARLDGGTQRLVVQGVRLEREHADLPHHRSAAGANGLEAMLPMDGPSGRLSALSRGGSPVFFTHPDGQGRRVRGLHGGVRSPHGGLRGLGMQTTSRKERIRRRFSVRNCAAAAASRRLSRRAGRRGRRRARTRARRRVRLRRELRHDGDRLLRQREGRHLRGERDEDGGALRVGRLAERLVGARRPAGARDVLQDGLHARGLGEAARGRDRRGRPRKLGRRRRRRPDDLGRPPRRPLPPDAQQGRGRRLPRLGPGPGRRAVAAPGRDLRRRRGALLRGRRRDGEQGLHRQRRRLEHVARRRLRPGPGRLLRRRDRRGARLRPRALGAGDPDGHGRAGRRPGRHARRARPRTSSQTSSTGTEIATSWQASTDDVGVTGYRVYRAGVSVAVVPGTTYTFTGLACGTPYTLGVEALDAAGNASARTTLSSQTAACDPQQPGGSRGRVPLRRRGRRHRDGRLRPRPDGDRGRSGLDGRALRLGALVQRLGRAGRRPGARHLLQDGLHLRGLGQAAVGRDGCRDPRKLERRRRRRPDDLGRPRLGPLPPDAEQGLRELPRLGPDAHGRLLAARGGDVRRPGRALLRRRRRGREPDLRRERGRLERLARRRVRARAVRLLPRRPRRDPDLRPGARRRRDRRRHGAERRLVRHHAADGAGALRLDRHGRDLRLGRLGRRPPTTPASPATGSSATGRASGRPPTRRSRSPASPAARATRSASRRSTRRATRRPARPRPPTRSRATRARRR